MGGTARIGLGCMPMSFGYVDAEAEDGPVDVIHRAIDLGAPMLDTADVYGPFSNEELVGAAIHDRRDRVEVATKVGLLVGPNGGYPLDRDASPQHVRSAIDASLRRLRTDVVDLYYLHRIDPNVPVEETWGAMAELVGAGKVRALGLSEVTVAEAERAHAIHPVAAIQSEMSLWTRDPLADIVPWCAEHGARFVPFSPLGRGFLTGAISAASFDESDFRSNNPRFTAEAVDANQAIVARVREVAERVGATPAQVALAWTLAQGEHVLPIPGTKRRRYLEENLAAGDLVLKPEDLTDLDALPVAEGARY
ncbi:MAG TPA: aldo/keto reductase [Actinomycetota bacterium]|nr:aldo/keto reductase [Actinomycetota bacterium]